MDIAQKIKGIVREAISNLGISVEEINLEHPTELNHGDFSTNVAMQLAKEAGKNPRILAQEIANHLESRAPSEVARVEVAGPGFINFHLSSSFFTSSIELILNDSENFGKNKNLSGQIIMVEYTDPNPFKVFHIGHLMSNAIGEAIARLHEFSGAEVVRACYQGDVGLHVAKTLWAYVYFGLEFPLDSDSLSKKVSSLGNAYRVGSGAYDEKDISGSLADGPSKEELKGQINEVNKKIYDRTDTQINLMYDKGRAWSLEHFEEIYKKLGTKFVHYFFESEVAEEGQVIVHEQLEKGVFQKSDGAIIFPGEEWGLHNRVFINSIGLPTYEAKELGLFVEKDKREPKLNKSIVITAEEQKEYMRVVVKALEQFNPALSEKFHHITHGMLRFAEGKMSSRKGNIVSGESLLFSIEKMSVERMGDRDMDDKSSLATQVAVGAIKYSVLKQSPGKDIIYDFEKSLSFEGDSGPYLQYTYARTQSILCQATEKNIIASSDSRPEGDASEVEKLIYRFPEVVESALDEYAPHHVATYLIELARAFNSFYGSNQIVKEGDVTSPYRVALTKAVGVVLRNGLYLLGISAPDRM